MKKYFITGLILLLPVTLTISIVVFMFNFLTTPFLGGVKGVFDYLNLFQNGFLFLNADQFQNLIAQVLILFCLFGITITIGLFTQWFFVRSIMRLTDYIVHKIPIISSIYKTCQEVINTLFASKANSFKQVVLVKFPNPASFAIGLVTREDITSVNKEQEQKLVAVFIPTTPNPTSGFLIMYKESDLTYLDMRVEDAFKCAISCGMIISSLKVITKEEALGILREEKASL